ncbi:hypothetical protein D3C71_1265770 [compost metagenome]
MAGAVIQAVQLAGQFVESTQLRVTGGGLLQGRQRGLHMVDLHAVAEERQQHAGAPQQGQGQSQAVSNARGAPAQATVLLFWLAEHALPGRVHGPEVLFLVLRCIGQRQAEPQAAQLYILPGTAEPRGQCLAPA